MRAMSGYKTKSGNPIDELVGGRVRMRRTQLGMSQEVLGNHLGLSFQQIQKYEKGKNRIGGSRMVQIANALDVSPAWFFGMEGYDGSSVEVFDLKLFMATQDGLRLAKAFGRLSHPMRRALVNVVQEIADGGSIAALRE